MLSMVLQEFSANIRLQGEQDLRHWSPEARASALHMCVHCADISNPAKPPRFGRLWAERITAEFFAQVRSPLHSLLLPLLHRRSQFT